MSWIFSSNVNSILFWQLDSSRTFDIHVLTRILGAHRGCWRLDELLYFPGHSPPSARRFGEKFL